MIRQLYKDDDINLVSQIIYQTDDFLFPFLFGKKEKAIPRISKLVKLDQNSFSYQFIHVHVDKKINGLMIEHDPNLIKKEDSDFLKSFSFIFIILLALKHLLLFPLLSHNIKSGRYIQNICVDATSRGQGIGTLLLLDAFDRAKKDGVKKMYLDVEINNKKALSLYEKHGFVKIKTRRIWFIFPATYFMEKIL